MTLTSEQITIVEQHPFDNTLNQFRAKYSSRSGWEEILGLRALFQTKTFHASKSRLSSLIFRRLSNLSSQTPPTPTFGRLWWTLSMHSTLLQLQNHSTREVIPTPRAGTSPKCNSSAGGEDHAAVAAKKDKPFDEVKNSLFRAVDGFWEKFFGTSRWEIDSPDRNQMYKNLLKEHRNGKCEGFPNNAKEHSVLKWSFGLREHICW
ncbi:hypothetical protein E4U46_006455, partial [Claviceps purpurea]